MSFQNHISIRRICWVSLTSMCLFLTQYFYVSPFIGKDNILIDFFGIMREPINIATSGIFKLMVTFFYMAILSLIIFVMDKTYVYLVKHPNGFIRKNLNHYLMIRPEGTLVNSEKDIVLDQEDKPIHIYNQGEVNNKRERVFSSSNNNNVRISEQEIVDFLTMDQLVERNQSGESNIDPLEKSSINTSNLETKLQDLRKMTGLDSVKNEILSIINFIRVNQMRVNSGLTNHDVSYHMVFTGNPGTGKTSIARILSMIFKDLNVVSKGHLIETDRAGMVAGFVGQTAIKVQETIERAKGGVLFIDEAYALTHDTGVNDYGKESIDTLLKYMEDYRHDLIVIVAGYSDLMKIFINSNPGLKSRFNRFIHFPDYSVEEMVEIIKKMAEKANYFFSNEAEVYLNKFFTWIIQNEREKFGNARGVRNLFEKIITIHANRMTELEEHSHEALTILLLKDVILAAKEIVKVKI